MLWSSFPSCYLHAQLPHFPKSRMTWPACKVHGLSLSSEVSFVADTIIIHPCVQTSKQFPNYTCTLPQPGKITLTTLDTQKQIFSKWNIRHLHERKIYIGIHWMARWTFWYWDHDIPGQLVQYRVCWYPSSEQQRPSSQYMVMILYICISQAHRLPRSCKYYG